MKESQWEVGEAGSCGDHVYDCRWIQLEEIERKPLFSFGRDNRALGGFSETAYLMTSWSSLGCYTTSSICVVGGG